MKKLLIASFCLFTLTNSYSQKGTTQIGVAADIGVPIGEDFRGTDDEGFKTGFGGVARVLFGVGTAGQITGTMGYSSFKMKGSTDDEKITMGISPFLLGYRHNFNGFYIEPQAGFATYKLKASITGVGAGSTSKGGFTFATGVGYVVNGFDFGVRYQSGSVKFEEADESVSISLIGFRIGYNFTLPKPKK
jgi:hypothetical protein